MGLVVAAAQTWPPLFATPAPAARTGVRADLLGTDPSPAGGQVVTYAGWPLYTYITDVQAGLATGQAIDLDGGLWYAMRPMARRSCRPAHHRSPPPRLGEIDVRVVHLRQTAAATSTSTRWVSSARR